MRQLIPGGVSVAAQLAGSELTVVCGVLRKLLAQFFGWVRGHSAVCRNGVDRRLTRLPAFRKAEQSFRDFVTDVNERTNAQNAGPRGLASTSNFQPTVDPKRHG